MKQHLLALLGAALAMSAAVAHAQPANPAATVGKRFYSGVFAGLCPVPIVGCGSVEMIGPNMGDFTVLAVVPAPITGTPFALVRRSDGVTGYTMFEAGPPWQSAEARERERREFRAGVARRQAEIAAIFAKDQAAAEARRERERECAAGRLHIGMTDSEALRAWCAPDHVNTTVTMAGTREQWVYLDRGYLYFEDRRLVAIQHR